MSTGTMSDDRDSEVENSLAMSARRRAPAKLLSISGELALISISMVYVEWGSASGRGVWDEWGSTKWNRRFRTCEYELNGAGKSERG